MEHGSNSVRNWLDRLVASTRRQIAAREVHRQGSRRGRSAARFLTIVILAGIAYLFVANLYQFLSWPPEVYGHPDVVNLTRSKVKWDIFSGDSPACGDLDCHLTPDYPVSKFDRSAALPLHEFPMRGYEEGDLVYYRTSVSLDGVAQADEPVLFHSVYMWAKTYWFYVEGQLVDIGGEQLLNIPIPKDLLEHKKRIDIAIKVDPGGRPYQGLTHYGDIVIGSRALLGPLKNRATGIRTTYHLWFIIPRLTLCILFGFMFLAMPRNTENLAFLILGFVGSAYLLLKSQFAEMLFPNLAAPRLWALLFHTFTSYFLILFVHLYFRRWQPRLFRAFLGLGALLAVGLVWGLFVLSEPQYLRINEIIEKTLRYGGTLYAFSLAMMTWLYLERINQRTFRITGAKILAAFFGASLLFYGAEVLNLIPGTYDGVTYDSHNLLLFWILSALVALEFGQTVVQRDSIKSRFRSFLDARVADRLLNDPSVMSPKTREVAVLFCDIRSFTTLSEQLPAEKVVGFLNEYLSVMVPTIGKFGGVVDKFGGDSIMAVWGAPATSSNPAQEALRCAVALRHEIHRFNEDRRRRGEFPVAVGIGVHFGSAVAGGIGPSNRTEYTVIGDTVNIAARLEAMTKEIGSDILISDAVWSNVKEGALVAYCGAVSIRGRSEALAVYKLIGMVQEDGRMAIQDPVLERAVAHEDPSPGLIECSVGNLETPDYSRLSSTSQAQPRNRAS